MNQVYFFPPEIISAPAIMCLSCSQMYNVERGCFSARSSRHSLLGFFKYTDTVFIRDCFIGVNFCNNCSGRRCFAPRFFSPFSEGPIPFPIHSIGLTLPGSASWTAKSFKRVSIFTWWSLYNLSKGKKKHSFVDMKGKAEQVDR